MTESTNKKNVRLRTIILVVALLVLAWLWKSWAVGPVDEILDGNSDEAVILNGWPKVQICINNGGKWNTKKGVCELAVDDNTDMPTDADDENDTLTGDGTLSGDAKLELDIKSPEEEPNPDPQPNEEMDIANPPADPDPQDEMDIVNPEEEPDPQPNPQFEIKAQDPAPDPDPNPGFNIKTQ